jgi:hypothetical protein|tara:strand:+ start:481 stop:2172 length:1692 start_codon:yes stop_codon:yes gene_type:complete
MGVKKGVRKYDQWSVGSGAATDLDVAEYNSVNAQVYENGNLGPRPGWKELAQTNNPATFARDTTDVVNAFQYWVETTGHEYGLMVWTDFSASNAVLTSEFDLALGTWEGSSSTLAKVGSAGALAAGADDDTDQYHSSNDGLVMSTVAGNVFIATTSTIGTAFGIDSPDSYPTGATAYRERMYYWGFASNPGRIYYSVAANYKNWDDGTVAGDATGWTDATSFFDVSYDQTSLVGAITGVWSVKNALLIARKDARWMVLTGASPATGSLRELGQDTVPDFNTPVIVDNELLFLDPAGKGVVIATPSFVETRALSYLAPTAYPGSTAFRPDRLFSPRRGVGDENTRDVFLPARATDSQSPDLVAAERINDVWSLSKWTHNISSQTISTIHFTKGRTNEMWCLADSDGGSSANTLEIYSRNLTLNRPGNSSDTRSKALSGESGTSGGSNVVLDLGTIQSADDNLLRPVKVVVVLDYWKGGNYTAPSLAIDAAVNGIEADTPSDSATQVVVSTSGWDNSTGNLPTTRRVSTPLQQLQWGTKADIRLTFNNLAIDNVRVYYEEIDDIR